MRSLKIMLSFQNSKFMKIFSLNMWFQDNFNMLEEKALLDLGTYFFSGLLHMIDGK